MPFKIVRDNITHLHADIIVNSANPRPLIGDGVDAAIHMAAGPELIAARKEIGDIPVGNVADTPGFGLFAKYVFHTVGPNNRKLGTEAAAEMLRNCYQKSLDLAVERRCRSIAFPLISTGNYGFPKDRALEIATSTISSFLLKNEMDVTLVVFDPESYVLSSKLFHDVKAYVDEHYVESAPMDWGIQQLAGGDLRKVSRRLNITQAKRALPREIEQDIEVRIEEYDFKSACIPMEEPVGETFSEMLLRLVDNTGKKDAEVYLKAHQTRQLFSKIRTNKEYRPSKNTVLAFALALELNMDQTLDLLKSAGYTLSDWIKLDVAIKGCILHGYYDMIQIKITLFEMGIDF